MTIVVKVIKSVNNHERTTMLLLLTLLITFTTIVLPVIGSSHTPDKDCRCGISYQSDGRSRLDLPMDELLKAVFRSKAFRHAAENLTKQGIRILVKYSKAAGSNGSYLVFMKTDRVRPEDSRFLMVMLRDYKVWLVVVYSINLRQSVIDALAYNDSGLIYILHAVKMGKTLKAVIKDSQGRVVLEKEVKFSGDGAGVVGSCQDECSTPDDCYEKYGQPMLCERVCCDWDTGCLNDCLSYICIPSCGRNNTACIILCYTTVCLGRCCVNTAYMCTRPI